MTTIRQRIFEELLSEFKKEDKKSWCGVCKKQFKQFDYSWEQHYNTEHSDINYNSSTMTKYENGKVVDVSEPMGRFIEWDMNAIRKVLNRVKNRK